MKDGATWKQDMLAHCLWMAQFDPDYALWAAAEYERRSAGGLRNLEAKVRQEIARKGQADAPRR